MYELYLCYQTVARRERRHSPSVTTSNWEREKKSQVCLLRLFRPVYTLHVKPDTHSCSKSTASTWFFVDYKCSVVESDWHRTLTYSNSVFPLMGEQHSPQDKKKTEMVRVRKVSMLLSPSFCSCTVLIPASNAHPQAFHLVFLSSTWLLSFAETVCFHILFSCCLSFCKGLNCSFPISCCCWTKEKSTYCANYYLVIIIPCSCLTEELFFLYKTVSPSPEVNMHIHCIGLQNNICLFLLI